MTVERGALVEFWPLVDIGRLDLNAGDLLVVKSKALCQSRRLRGRFIDELERHIPDLGLIFDDGTTEFVVKRPMPDMRWEDLYRPVRKTTMEA